MDSNWRQLLAFLWTNHRGTFLGTLAGLAIGILMATIGFWKTLLVSSFVFLGFLVGRRFDRSGSWGDLLDHIFRD